MQQEQTPHITPETSPKKKKRTLFQKIKRFGIIGGAVMVVLLIIGIILAYVFEKDIKKYAVEEINKQLISDLNISEENISFSLIKKFPKAGLAFNNLLILEKNQTDTLLFAKKLTLEFGLFSVLNGNYTVNEIDVSDGLINVKLDKNGKGNYVIWEEVVDTTNTQKPFQFDIKKLNLKNIALSFKDERSGFNTGLNLDKTTFKGAFNNKTSTINVQSNHQLQTIGMDSIVYFANKASNINFDLLINNNSNVLTINKGDITIEKMDLKASGTYNINNNTYDIKSITNNVEIASIFSLLPQHIVEQLQDYKTNGVVNGKTAIKQTENSSTPDVKSTFLIENGTLTERHTGAKITNLNVKGKYTLTRNAQNLTLEKLNGNLAGGSFNGNAKIIGKKTMSVFSSFNGNANLKQLADFLNLGNVENLEGQIKLNNQLRGTIKNGQFNVSQLSGKTDLKNTALKLVGKKYSLANLSGDFMFNQYTSSGKFTGVYGSSDFAVDVQVKNMIEHIIDNKPLFVTTYIQSERLVVDEILMLASSNQEQDKKEIADTNFHLPKNITTNISANIGELFYGKHELKQFKGNLLVSPWQVSSNNLSFIANDGIYALSASLKPNKEQFKLTADAICGHINVTDFFNRFDNFGQNILEARHIKGSTDAVINLSANLTSGLTVLTKSLDVTTDFTITNGELIGFELFDEMATYIKGNKIAKTFVKVDQLSNKLKHIKFSEMTNQLIIKNEKIILPDMLIKSSAMDVGVYGSQSFSGEMKYGVNFRLADVLTKDKTSDFGYIVDDGTGRRLFLSIAGTTDNPNFSLDKEARKKHNKKKAVAEKNTLKSILKKEFGLFKNHQDTPEERPEENKPQITIEWEDEEEQTSSANSGASTQTTTKTQAASEPQKAEKKKKPSWLKKLTGKKKTEKEKTGFVITDEEEF